MEKNKMGSRIHLGLVALVVLAVFIKTPIDPAIYAGVAFGALVSAIMEAKFHAFRDVGRTVRGWF